MSSWSVEVLVAPGLKPIEIRGLDGDADHSAFLDIGQASFELEAFDFGQGDAG